jgi:hypothetical protein
VQHPLYGGQWHDSEAGKKALDEQFVLAGFPSQVPATETVSLPVTHSLGRSFFGLGERVIIMTTCLMVIATCCALLYALIDLYVFLGRVQEALENMNTDLLG